MQEKDITKLGALAFHQCLRPLKTSRVTTGALVMGFDTEYDSETRELLSLQFSHKGFRDWYLPAPDETIDWAKLETMILDFLSKWGIYHSRKKVASIKLITWWSLAETQHITDLGKATVFETSIGTDFTYHGRGGRTIEIIDAMKFFNNPPQPLAKVAEAFGYKKGEWNRERINRADLSAPGFFEYATNDAKLCEDIFNALRQAYLDDYGVDILLSRTPAQTSATIYRKFFLDSVCEQPATRLRKLALRACWGGRNEAFRRGIFDNGKDWYEYDAFSEYPNSVIQIGILPRAQDWQVTESVEEMARYHGVARVRFRFPSFTPFPCLPVFGEVKGATFGKLIYPLEGESYCTNAEIALALELGAEITILEAYHYRTGTESLARYMEGFLAERTRAKESGDKIRAHVIKLALNSLIGKFVQRVVKKDINSLNILSEKSGIPTAEFRRFELEALETMCREYGLDSDAMTTVSVGSAFYPEWNTLILGYARASTSRFIIALANAGHKPGICSTDSVIFEAASAPADSYNVNGIRFEQRERGNHMAIVRTRLYRLGNGAPSFVDGKDVNEIKIAHHAVARKNHARDMFQAFISDPELPEFFYDFKRITTYRESVVYGREYGADSWQRDRRTRLGFDNKRRLNGCETDAWKTLDLANAIS